MDAMIGATSAPAAAAPPVAAAAAEAAPSEPPGAIKSFFSGLYKSGLDTAQGVKQIATYAVGSEEQQRAVNQAIAEANERFGPSMDSMPGKLGYVLGVIGQFMIPGAVAGQVVSKLPAVAAAAPRAISTLNSLTAPQSITAGALGGAAFEATRPTDVPPEAGPAEFVKGKIKQGILGGAGGGVATGVGKLISTYAKPMEGPARTAAQEIVDTAKKSGMPPLLYGQIRQDPMVRIIEEGAAITPGAAGPMRAVVRPQKEYVNKVAAQAIGSAAERPTGVEIENAAKSAINAGYKPFAANVKQLKGDVKLWDDLEGFLEGPVAARAKIKAQGGPSALKAAAQTGQTWPEALATPQGISAARMVRRDAMAKTPMTGDRIIDLIQDLRNMKFDHRIDASAKSEIKQVEQSFLDWVERASQKKYGPDAQKWYGDLAGARQKLSTIHRVKEATELPMGEFNPAKFVRKDVTGSPSRAAGTTAGPLAKVAELSRLSQMVRSPIGSSGTTERWMGSRVINALSNPLATAFAAAATGKAIGDDPAEQAAYGIGLMLASHGVGKALTSNVLRRNAISGFPRVNYMAQRLLVPTVVGGGEAISQ